jgi:hypothetical protein
MSYYDPGFYGTERYYRYPIGNYLFTDSVKYFCEEHEAFWTLDVIGSYMDEMRRHPFLLITFDVKDGKCDFYVQEDTGTKKLIKQHIAFTDLGISVRLYLENGVLLFPSDH